MTVRITGPVLSALLYEHSSANNDLEGLLLGNVTDVIKNTINDSSISNVESRTLYSVFSCIPCSFGLRWYDNTMKVNGESLEKLLTEHSKTEIVGWFKLRRNSSLNVSVKERSISKNLLKWLQENGDYKRRDMLFMLCVSHYASKSALFICDHLFMKYDGGSFVTIPETVTNLAEAVRANYCPPTGSVTSPDSCYNRVMEKFMPTFLDERRESAIVGEIRQLSAKLHSKLKSLSQTVEESEQSVVREMAKISSLQQRITREKEAVAKTELATSSPSDAASLLLSDLDDDDADDASKTARARNEPVTARDHLITIAAETEGEREESLVCSSSSSSRSETTATDLLMDADDVDLPIPLLTPMSVTGVVVPPSSNAAPATTSLLDNVQLSEETPPPTMTTVMSTEVLDAEPLHVDDDDDDDDDGSATSQCSNAITDRPPQSKGRQQSAGVVVAKTAEEPFGFVSEMMSSYASPTRSLGAAPPSLARPPPLPNKRNKRPLQQ